ncbi:DUF5615 family PIN-like protein [Flavobacterium psychrotolerans]|uniref:DUF5615 domain-containing protein n=1 Tax=Flavobacterium psychrotolerans TaxID=2169410 RepID=A0A2U1JPR8_9FLAO|nr:DUF5615 family PIN-like protein [Flavobacterium psychrotolerans]PWA07161.1 hypothetical protein DB895_00065 [Flavobacterium psychrotolerans]
MKFLCDVHISIKFVKHINNSGIECVHINTILDKWFTADYTIAKFSDVNNFILITKDFDFKNSFLVNKSPKKLIKINLGNISNEKLIEIFSLNLEKIKSIDKEHNNFMIEIDKEYLNLLTY